MPTDAKRAKAHENVRKLLKNAPVPKDAGPAKPCTKKTRSRLLKY